MSKGSSQCLQRKRNRPVCLYEGDCNNGWLCLLAKHLGSGLGLKGQLLLTQTMKCAIDEATYSIVNMTFGKKRIDKVDKYILPFFIFKRRSNRTVIFINSPPMKKRNYRYIEKRNVMKEAERPTPLPRVARGVSAPEDLSGMFMLCQAAGEAFVCVVCIVSFGWGAGKGRVVRAFTAVPGRCVARCRGTTWHARILTCVRARVHTRSHTKRWI